MPDMPHNDIEHPGESSDVPSTPPLVDEGQRGGEAPAAPQPSLYQRFKQAAKRLKQEVLALYYALQDPRTGLLPRALGLLVLAYALSPFDLIPDFIPILGIVDDLLLLPGMIWLTIRLIPGEVMEDSRSRAEQEPLRLRQNWGAACAIFALWDALLLWLLRAALTAFGPPEPPHWRWWAVGGAAGALVAGEVAWGVWQARRERQKEGNGRPTAAAGGANLLGGDGSLEEGLLSGEQEH